MSIIAFYKNVQIVGIFAFAVTGFGHISPFDLGGLK
jgi:hypothetical protein